MTDVEYMQVALKCAEQAAAIGEVPVGAIAVIDGKIVAESFNLMEQEKTALAHAEILVIKELNRIVGDWRLDMATIYVTKEPCPMCAGAIQWANIYKVYQGCNVRDAESIGFRDKRFYEEEWFNTETIDRKACLELFDEYRRTNPQNY